MPRKTAETKLSPTDRLLKAIERGRTADVEALLAAGITAYPGESRGCNGALMLAAYYGRREMVRRFLDLGYDPNDAIIAAANMGRLTSVRMLLDAGANPNEADEEGMSALHWAVHPDLGVRRGHIGIVKALLKAGADPNVQNTSGHTPLFFAHDCDWPVIEALLRAGADINAKDHSGGTPLVAAAHGGRFGNVMMFVERYGANASDCGPRETGPVGYALHSDLWAAQRTLEQLRFEGCSLQAGDRQAIRNDIERLSREVEALLSTTGKLRIAMNSSELLDVIREIEPWPSTPEYLEQHWVSLRKACRAMESADRRTILRALRAADRELGAPNTQSYLLIRAAFDLPEDAPWKKLFDGSAYFGRNERGERVPRGGDPDRQVCNLAWPLSFSDGTPKLVAGIAGKIGGGHYSLADEYKYVAARYPYRNRDAWRAIRNHFVAVFSPLQEGAISWISEALDTAGIPFNMHGSRGLCVQVAEVDRERALEVLERDSTLHGYAIHLHR